MAESRPITEYEQKRLENIKQNEQKIASLKLQSIATELSSESKRQRTNNKISKSETPARRSLRTRGCPPDPSSAKGLPNYYIPSPVKYSNSHLLKNLGPLSMQDIFFGDSSDRTLVNTINDISENTPLGHLEKRCFVGNGECFDSSSMVLKGENIVHVALGRIMNMKFFSCIDRTMIVAGDAFGDVVFWNVGCEGGEGEGGGIYRYRPYTLPVSGISIKPFSLSKVFTSSYDGFIWDEVMFM